MTDLGLRLCRMLSWGARVVTASLVPKGLCSIPEAAKFLSISRGKVYLMINSGECPSKRFGKSVRIPWEWLLKQAEIPGDEGEVAR